MVFFIALIQLLSGCTECYEAPDENCLLSFVIWNTHNIHGLRILLNLYLGVPSLHTSLLLTIPQFYMVFLNPPVTCHNNSLKRAMITSFQILNLLTIHDHFPITFNTV